MHKRITVEELKLGMYVVELDRPWRDTPFMFQGFEIRTDEEIVALQRHCQYVHIVLPESYNEPRARHHAVESVEIPRPGSSSATAEHFDDRALLRRVSSPRFPATYSDRSLLEEEMVEVRYAHAEAKAIMQTAMEDVRLGKGIDGDGAKKIVGDLVDSTLRNPDALTCFTQLKNKDEYTATHSLRVCILALAFGRHLGLPLSALHMLGVGALLHDLGKMKIPNDILNKPGELTEGEFEIMKTHVPCGVDILENTPAIPQAAIDVARCHHERYSGTGYANGFKGDEIGLFGMIGGIVDCYDAVSSDRAYHKGLSSHATLKLMYEWRGREFHAGLVEQFIQCMGIYPIGSVVALNTGDVGVVITMNRTRRLKPRVALVRKADGTRYESTSIIDLTSCVTRDGKPCEIERVLEPSLYGINPVDYLPIPIAA